jgi:uncharacterized protein YjbJ (UPF0337 family)
MNRETQVAFGNVNQVVGILSGDDRPEDDGEVDRIVMKLASEKVREAVEKER